MVMILFFYAHKQSPQKLINNDKARTYINLCSLIDMTHRYTQQDFIAPQQWTNLLSNFLIMVCTFISY